MESRDTVSGELYDKIVVDIPSGVACLIVSYPTGIEYTNQTGGYSCHHPSLEGFCVPLAPSIYSKARREWVSLQDELDKILGMESKYSGACWDGIDNEDADRLDALFEELDLGVVVDRNRLGDSEEAWVWVIVTRDTFCFYGKLGPSVAGHLAVLTWENSD